ncbi:MAG: hypothetical protein KKC19_00090 [Nanoarchaeota archaeon]|nr:hypothetical protein [Nanoarchaeota archaeon]
MVEWGIEEEGSVMIFEIMDKTGRRIRLTEKQWKHIRKDHPEIEDEMLIKNALRNPTKITSSSGSDKFYYYNYYKDRISSDRYLLAVVKYLNGDGFVITAFYVKYIR